MRFKRVLEPHPYPNTLREGDLAMQNAENMLFMLTADQQTIIKRVKRLPDDADTDDISMALDEILDELSTGQ